MTRSRRVATEAAGLNGNNLEKRRNKEEERENARKRLTLTGLLMEGVERVIIRETVSNLFCVSKRDSGLVRGCMAERAPENALIPSMPMRLNELVVLMRCLKDALESERISEGDKTVVQEIMRRINLFAERQGAWWDKLE